MPIADKESTHPHVVSERQQTDESLRAEREKADQTLGEQLADVDEAADAVIVVARARADKVLAAARAKTDRQTTRSGPANIAEQRQRSLEDQTLQKERAGADEAVRAERAEQVAVLSRERHETDRDLFSERARSDDSLATRDEFLALVSHDLLNLLNTIVLYARLVTEEVLRDDHIERVTQHARRIQRASSRMNRLIGDLVDVASIEAGALAVTRELSDPAQIVSEAVSSLQGQASAKSLSLVAVLEPSLAPAALDAARIHQVLINLISNAIKFTPEHGKIAVRARRVGADIRIDVIDTGIGIASDMLEVIFERFVQIKKNDTRGVGLGLYISRCIVQGHGGRIWAESKTGEGSTVCFTLPAEA